MTQAKWSESTAIPTLSAPRVRIGKIDLRTLPPPMLIYGEKLLRMNELHRTVRSDSARHHT